MGENGDQGLLTGRPGVFPSAFFLPLSFYSFELCIVLKLQRISYISNQLKTQGSWNWAQSLNSSDIFYRFEQPALVGVRRIQDIDAKTIISKLHCWFPQKNLPNFLAAVNEQLLISHWVELVEADPRRWLLLLSEHMETQNTPCVLQRRISTNSNPWEWQNFVAAEFPNLLTFKNNHGSRVSSLCTCTLQVFLLLCEKGGFSLPFVTSSSRKCLVVCLRSTTHARIAETLCINLHKPLHSLQSYCSQ